MISAVLALSSSANTLLIAMLIPILGVVSPLLLAQQINRNTSNSKKQDWERQDVVSERAERVAKKAEEAALLIVQRQIALDSKTDEVARLLATQTTETSAQLDKIGYLVNSHFTEAIRSELGATKDTLGLMSELLASHKKAGIEPTMEMMAAFRGREEKIRELEETLRIREEADRQSKIIAAGPQEVVIVNPEPVPVTDKTITKTGETTNE